MTTSPRPDRPRGDERSVVIVGAGYAGVLAANRLRASLTAGEAARWRVTVVNPTDRFVERIRLHQVVAGSIADASVALSEMLHADVELLVGAAVRIDPDARTVDVETATGMRPLVYDLLVYAVGSGGRTTADGAADHAHQVADPEGAARAGAAIAAGAPGQRVVVVGGGFTGIETASEIAERNDGARVTLLSAGPVAAAMRPAARRGVLRALRSLGVDVREGAGVARVGPDRVELSDGSVLPADVCVWAASFSVPPLARLSGLPTDELGRLRVDEHLRCVDHPEIVGAGDAVALPAAVGGHLRMGCASAMPLGGFAASTVLARLRGTTPGRASAGYLVQCLSLGRRRGYVQVVRADDSPRPYAIGGRLGAVVKEAVCTMTVRALRGERDRPGSYRAPRGPRRAGAPAAGARAVDATDGAATSADDAVAGAAADGAPAR